jgi:F0F1-type ATP synthase assembly protein I
VAGFFVDRWLGTLPLFMLVGLVLGFVASLFYVYRAIKNLDDT